MRLTGPEARLDAAGFNGALVLAGLKATGLTILFLVLALATVAVVVWTHGAVLIVFSVFLFWYVLFDKFREKDSQSQEAID